MSRPLQIVLSLDHAYAYDRRAFDGITATANQRRDVRLIWRMNDMPFREMLSRRAVDGFIVARIDDRDELKDLTDSGKPFVSLADNLTHKAANQYIVALDEQAIGRQAAEHFLDGGFKRFVVLCRPSVRDFFAQRINAFCKSVKDHDRTCEVGPPSRSAEERGDHRSKAWEDVDLNTWDAEVDIYLKSLGTPLAVFAPYDSYAQVAVNSARSIGLRVPDDVAVVGVDDDEVYCMTTSPQLCSVKTPARQIGQQALKLLLDVLDGRQNVPSRTLIEPSGIMLRGSSCATAVGDPDVIAAVRFIRDHIGRGLTVDEVAEHVLLSRRTLERRFMMGLSRTVQAEVRRAKIHEAKRLLTDTDLSYYEVARLSGLAQQQQLNRLIKLDTGLTPGQFRNANRTHRFG